MLLPPGSTAGRGEAAPRGAPGRRLLASASSPRPQRPLPAGTRRSQAEKPCSEPAPSDTIAATALNPREFWIRYFLSGKVELDCQTGDLQWIAAPLKITINTGLEGKTEKPIWRREGIRHTITCSTQALFSHAGISSSPLALRKVISTCSSCGPRILHPCSFSPNTI